MPAHSETIQKPCSIQRIHNHFTSQGSRDDRLDRVFVVTHFSSSGCWKTPFFGESKSQMKKLSSPSLPAMFL